MAMNKLDDDRLGLSDMPAEIRNLIYYFALSPSSDGPVRLTGGAVVGRDIALNLLATSTIVGREAAGVLNNDVGFRVDLCPVTKSMWPDSLTWSKWKKENCGDYSSYTRVCEAMMDSLGKPNMLTSLATMGGKRLGSIKRFTFVFRKVMPKIKTDDAPSLSEKGDLAFTLRLLPRSPYYRIIPARAYATDTREDAYTRTTGYCADFIADMVAIRRLKTLARNDINQHASWVLEGFGKAYLLWTRPGGLYR